MGDDCEKQLNLGNFLFDEENHERKSWKFFGGKCDRSLLVLVFQFFCLSFNNSMCNRSNNVIYM